ncbi:hypothetical protein E2C01_016576 [Portunus trituberculatus]|uniref:Uncharacterized protein n=1 Tax=Portunus trituberculatus TaxID=210409 RepID=A0A5B7DPG0_PORTR|nr:hypothetical protein [Portunus trituberculatus]
MSVLKQLSTVLEDVLRENCGSIDYVLHKASDHGFCSVSTADFERLCNRSQYWQHTNLSYMRCYLRNSMTLSPKLCRHSGGHLITER